MTLATSVLVLDPVPVEPLWFFCRGLVGSTVATRWEDRERSTTAGARTWANLPGQGLGALLTLDWCPDGFMPAEACEDSGAPVRYVYDVTFDTAYGYEAANGARCGDLHAHYVQKLARWLDQRGARWLWQDEGEGTWYGSLDGLHVLGDPDLGNPYAEVASR